ncbi:TPA: DUF1828 domain-containing protein [Streptococcus pyogenes]|uniref:DUF1828 domain-containing protein n=1 Tax=Streptococcus pyogenes TaxID=1314 RepID=UPI00050CBE8D|nr:DUF1828 domain-containing protein [Streptococcus pyogenes]KGE56552.1 hypothetical protein SPYAA216_0777 [Streptococcus pyogenes AA216]HER4552567.1 DUF1828 domain-containing protein [Streptococcus pyogenes NGAS664]HER4799158.1 DUF1828 domain-containing protein [Streptococcus pyogenes NGAS113]HER4804172.1 DUF1828 domain-containing protein [Streptococcus pyogenes NGAS130]ANC74360.1 hypothetical protein A4265_03585 [Streptococcus pyogenes]
MKASDVKKEYLAFVKENTIFNNATETHTEVVTPFVDPFGEAIGFSIKSNGKSLTITDDSYTIWNLSINGIDVTKKGRRNDLFLSLLHYNGFDLVDKAIERTVSKANLGQAIHDMTQLLMNVYDFIQLSPNNVKSQFLDDVKSYFMSDNHYSVFPAFSIAGRSRLEHRFNFVFMSHGISKIARVHNHVTKQQVDTILASWLDTSEFRKREYGDKEELYIIVSDDGFKNMKDDHLIALQEYNIHILNFADKQQLQMQLGK